MARKLRIQYEGAIYHVINRGNYRRDLFESVGTAQAFETTLFEACELHAWKLHAFTVMRNHFHLAVETPRANLAEGMHWLQGTFAVRFNRFRTERGHLFQGRYHALLIENAAALARVVDYIHLNPARANIVTPTQLNDFRWSSLRKFLRGPRPEFLTAEYWLAARQLTDSDEGWQTYANYLHTLASDEAEQKRLGFEQLTRGWAIGTDGWRRALAKEHAARSLVPDLASKELHDLKVNRWLDMLEQALAQQQKTRELAQAARANVPWKVNIAMELRKIGASYAWIAEQLHMGKAVTARVYVNKAKSNK
jgi:putative transposase